MLHKFDAHRLAVQFYRDGKKLQLPSHLKSQFARSSSSIVLNLAEGSGRAALADRRHFFAIALGSLRESQAVLDLAEPSNELRELSNRIGGCLWRLTHGR